MGYAARQNAAAKAAKKRHTTAFQGLGDDGRKASRRPRGKGSRPVRLNLALSDEEAEFLREQAEAAGMSVSYWIVAAATAFANGAESLVAPVVSDEGTAQIVSEDPSGQLYLTDPDPGQPRAGAKRW